MTQTLNPSPCPHLRYDPDSILAHVSVVLWRWFLQSSAALSALKDLRLRFPTYSLGQLGVQQVPPPQRASRLRRATMTGWRISMTIREEKTRASVFLVWQERKLESENQGLIVFEGKKMFQHHQKQFCVSLLMLIKKVKLPFSNSVNLKVWGNSFFSFITLKH